MTLRLLDELPPDQIGTRLAAIFRAKLAEFDHEFGDGHHGPDGDFRRCPCEDCTRHRQQFETKENR